jgi:hypothetical protein
MSKRIKKGSALYIVKVYYKGRGEKPLCLQFTDRNLAIDVWSTLRTQKVDCELPEYPTTVFQNIAEALSCVEAWSR